MHSDNADVYQTDKFMNMIKSQKGIQSFSKPGNSLDNKLAEYFFSILKQEYLVQNKPKTFQELQKLLKEIKYHYNFVRKQGNLQWKSPAQCRA